MKERSANSCGTLSAFFCVALPLAACQGGDGSEEGPPIAPFDNCMTAGTEAVAVTVHPPPETMMAGDVAPVSLTFANCGTATWSPVAADAMQGYKLGSLSPNDNLTWGVSRVALPGEVPPDHQVRFDFDAIAPTTNGTYAFQWGIVEETVRWLEQPSVAVSIDIDGGEGFAFHPRSEWQVPGQEVTGPVMDASLLEYITIHYNGEDADLDGDDDIYQDSDYLTYLQEQQALYLSTKGYSLAYNSMIAPDGDEWEMRGMSVRNAANGCTAVNAPGYAIQLTLTSPTTPPSETQLAGLRFAIARARAAIAATGNARALAINGHRDVRPACGNGGTACPGDALYALIQQGAL